MKTGIELIVQERKEQIGKHGRSILQDIEVNNEEQLLTAASTLLCIHDDDRDGLNRRFKSLVPKGWDESAWMKMANKPKRERLIIAGALIAAELDRINHSSPSATKDSQQPIPSRP